MDSIFGVGTAEFVLILILATIVMGPRRMRSVARQLGRWTAQLQAIARGFRRQLNAELDAESRADLKGAVDEIAVLRKQVFDLRSEIYGAANEVGRSSRSAADEARAVVRSAGAAGGASSAKALEPDLPAEENRIQPPLPTPVDIPDDPET